MVVKTEISTYKDDIEVKRIIIELLYSLIRQIQAIDYQGEIFYPEGDMILRSARVFISDKVVDTSSVKLSTQKAKPIASFMYQQMRDANLNTPDTPEINMGNGILLTLPDIISPLFIVEGEDRTVDFIGTNISLLTHQTQAMLKYTGRNSEQRWQGLGSGEKLRVSYRRNYMQENFIDMPFSHILSALRAMNIFMRPE